jgi:hypothetical protein
LKVKSEECDMPCYIHTLFIIHCFSVHRCPFTVARSPLPVHRSHFFLSAFWLDPKSSKKLKIAVRYHPPARAGSHGNQATALLKTQRRPPVQAGATKTPQRFCVVALIRRRRPARVIA